jgi:hypothetical protein
MAASCALLVCHCSFSIKFIFGSVTSSMSTFIFVAVCLNSSCAARLLFRFACIILSVIVFFLLSVLTFGCLRCVCGWSSHSRLVSCGSAVASSTAAWSCFRCFPPTAHPVARPVPSSGSFSPRIRVPSSCRIRSRGVFLHMDATCLCSQHTRHRFPLSSSLHVSFE